MFVSFDKTNVVNSIFFASQSKAHVMRRNALLASQALSRGSRAMHGIAPGTSQ
jgi:hypothetical protein